MLSSGMLRCVALVRTDVSEEPIRVHLVFLCSVHQLLITANVPSLLILVVMMEVPGSSETSVLTRTT
jgi:hypothetical protein